MAHTLKITNDEAGTLQLRDLTDGAERCHKAAQSAERACKKVGVSPFKATERAGYAKEVGLRIEKMDRSTGELELSDGALLALSAGLGLLLTEFDAQIASLADDLRAPTDGLAERRASVVALQARVRYGLDPELFEADAQKDEQGTREHDDDDERPIASEATLDAFEQAAKDAIGPVGDVVDGDGPVLPMSLDAYAEAVEGDGFPASLDDDEAEALAPVEKALAAALDYIDEVAEAPAPTTTTKRRLTHRPAKSTAAEAARAKKKKGANAKKGAAKVAGKLNARMAARGRDAALPTGDQ